MDLRRHEHRPDCDPDDLLHLIAEGIYAIGVLMTEFASDQAHLDADVAGLTSAISTAVAELKAAIAAGTPATSLDFTALDALVSSTQAEAAADAPPAPSDLTADTPIADSVAADQAAAAEPAPVVEDPAPVNSDNPAA